jgi:hypothetical protein
MGKENYQDILEKMKELLELCAEKEDDDDEEEEILKSIKKDYDEFFFWATGDSLKKVNKGELLIKWQKLHPQLAIPRILLINYDLGKELSTVCLFMDAYPLYLESLKK